ncbi:uracil permease-3 [Coleophoma cylindrospora]|uniref:Uracil permease-3 n=1 Tax=Coleophoma cylindrospora TaxID=1849047 RepID=A0A3D8SGV5_9HELO|nr:uracil permease-3 [Coleophoma cylindrospora]
MSILRAIDNKIRIHDDEDGRTIDRWTNLDILPVLPKNRTFTSKAYVSYWISGAVCASFWSMGSSAIASGLTAAQAVGAMIVAAFVCSVVAWFCGEPGIMYYLGFPMMSRATFGMRGSYFVVLLKCFTTFIFCGIQSYWGGLAIHVILAAIFPSYHHMRNTLPAGFGAVVATILGMFIWAMSANRGAGNLVAPVTKLSTGDTAFVFIQSICTVCGSFTGSSVRHSDWSRYAKTPKSPRIGILVAGPLALTLTAMFGIFVTSAARDMYGEVLWQPVSLLLYIQTQSYTPGVRAGTFFAGVGWLMSQLAVNVSLNSVSAGMDLTAILPQYLNARRGSLLVALVGFAACPWNYVNSSSVFTTVLSSFGLFISPLIGIYMIDFWVVRKKNWKVPDLYIGNSSSIYWFHYGFHWRAFVVWLGLIWLSLPGFVSAITGKPTALAWKRIFQITYFVGWLGGMILYAALCYVFPVPHAQEYEEYDWSTDAGVTVLDAKTVEAVDGEVIDEKV